MVAPARRSAQVARWLTPLYRQGIMAAGTLW